MRKPTGKHVEISTRVRYKETDQMGIAHHSNYVVWFEIGRTTLCAETGFSYRDIEERGFFLVVTEIGCKYRIPYRYDDEVILRTSIEEGGRRLLRFRYELFDSTRSLLHADGFSSHIWVDKATRRPAILDDAVLAAFRPWFP